MPRRKALKVVVDVELHAVTCPGVFLPDREDVFIDIDIFGHRKRTQCHPPVFPFLFHEKIRFDKVFSNATDPIQVAQELCAESVQIELIQLSYPGGELLGTYEDNARDFLFPTPKVSPTYPGVDREVLLQRSASFPGIAPKLEFSSRTTIKEVTSSGRSTASEKKKKEQRVPTDLLNGGGTHETQISSQSKMYSPKKKKSKSATNTESRRGRSSQRAKSASRGTTMWGYEQPTIASRARSPSPYTRRRMAELSISDPFESAAKRKPFKTEIDSKPDFVVRKVLDDALSLDRTPPSARTPSYERRSPRHSGRSGKSYLSPRHNATGSPRMASYNSVLSQSSDEAASSDWSSSSELRAFADKFSSDYGAARPKPWQCYNSIGEYMSSNYKDGFRNRISPSPDRNHRSFSRSTPNSPRFSHHSPERRGRQYLRTSSSYHKQRLKPCLVTRSAPNSARTNKEPPRTVESRIAVCLENILKDVRRTDFRNQNSHQVSGRNSLRKKTERVRFQDSSDMNTSLRGARGTPTGSRPSSSHSYSATVSPRRTDPSFSLADLDTVPPSIGRRRLSPNSILLRTPLEDRLKAQPSPYEKIRDRVRALLSSPRATQIADDAMYEGEARYRQRMSRTPSPRSPRMSVPITDTDYWNEKASEYTGKSHRKLFEENLGKIHDDIYNKLRSSN